MKFARGIVILFLFLTNCVSQPAPAPDWRTETRIIMATPITISLTSAADKHVAPLFDIFKSVDHSLSSYMEDSDIGRLNREKRLTVSHQTITALRKALTIAEQSQGAFDPTIGALTLNVYKFGGPEARVPSASEIKKARASVDYRKVFIMDRFVRIEKDTLIDLGGIGKGYAVDLAAAYLLQQGVQQAVIAASGDIRCLHSCLAGIQHPFNIDKELVTFRSRGSVALSTSGPYHRKVNQNVHHLLNPRTGKSADYYASITLAAKDNNTLIDGLSTAIAVTPWPQARKLLANYPQVDFLIVDAKKDIWISHGFWSLVEDVRWSSDKADFNIVNMTENRKN